MLTAPRHVAMVEAGERAHRPVHAAGIIHIRPAPAGRRFVGQAGDIGQPRDRLGNGTECRVVVMPAGMAVARHRHIDDVRLDLALLRIAEAPFLQHPGAEVLNHDVGDGDQPLDDLQAFGASYVETEALLVDVRVIEVSRGVEIDLEILRRGGARQPAALIFRPLDLYDLGPESSQPARGPRSSAHPAEIHHADVLKGSRARHDVVLLRRAWRGKVRPSLGSCFQALPRATHAAQDQP